MKTKIWQRELSNQFIPPISATGGRHYRKGKADENQIIPINSLQGEAKFNFLFIVFSLLQKSNPFKLRNIFLRFLSGIMKAQKHFLY